MIENMRHVKGLSEVLRKLDGLPMAIRKKVIEPALYEGAKTVRAAAKRKAPKDTGNLTRKIKIVKVKEKDNSLKVEYLIGADVRTKGIAYSEIDTRHRKVRYEQLDRPAFYSDFLEKGYFKGKRRFRKGGEDAAVRAQQHAGHEFVAPKPYLVPAFDSVQDQVINDFITVADTVLDKVIKDL